MTRYLPLASLRPFFAAPAARRFSGARHQVSCRVRHGLVAGLLTILLTALTPLGQIVTAAPGEPDAAVASSNIAASEYEADIDSFWRQRVTNIGGTYWTPVVIPMSDAVNSGCGYVEPHQYLAFYCIVDAAVYWSVPEYEQAVALSGDAAWVNVMAHEWSHHVQMLLGLNTPWRQNNDSVGLELEATCMGGAYVANARERGLVDDDMIASMVGMFGGSETHGTTEQVRSAFRNGVDSGIAACGVAL